MVHFSGKSLCLTISRILLLLWFSIGTNTLVAGEKPFGNLINMDGKAANPSSTIGTGKWSLVMIWATDCPVCKQQKPKVSAFYDKHKDVDADVFGISLDGKQDLKKVNQYIVDHKPTFRNFVGELRRVASDYQSLTGESFRGTPTYLLFNPRGELEGVNPGPITVRALEKFIAKKNER